MRSWNGVLALLLIFKTVGGDGTRQSTANDFLQDWLYGGGLIYLDQFGLTDVLETQEGYKHSGWLDWQTQTKKNGILTVDDYSESSDILEGSSSVTLDLETSPSSSPYWSSPYWEEFTWAIVERVQESNSDDVLSISIIDLLPTDDETEDWTSTGEELVIGDLIFMLEDMLESLDTEAEFFYIDDMVDSTSESLYDALGTFDDALSTFDSCLCQLMEQWFNEDSSFEVVEVIDNVDEKPVITRLRSVDELKLQTSLPPNPGKLTGSRRRFCVGSIAVLCSLGFLSGIVIALVYARRNRRIQLQCDEPQMLCEPLMGDCEEESSVEMK